MVRDWKNQVVSNKRWEIKSSIKLWTISQGEIKTRLWMSDQIAFMEMLDRETIALKERGAKVSLIKMHQLLSTDTHQRRAISVCTLQTRCIILSNPWFQIIEIKTLNWEITWAIIRSRTLETKLRHIRCSIRWFSRYR